MPIRGTLTADPFLGEEDRLARWSSLAWMCFEALDRAWTPAMAEVRAEMAGLVRALAVGARLKEPDLARGHLEWFRRLARSRGWSGGRSDRILDCLRKSCPESDWLEVLPDGFAPESHDDPLGRPELEGPATQFHRLLREGDRQGAMRLVESLLEEGMTVREVFLDVFLPSQREFGRLWETGEISIAEEHFATASTQFAISSMYQRLFAGKRTGRRVLVACAPGELHEIGTRMAADLFELDGWDSVYLGSDNSATRLASDLRSHAPHLVVLGCTLVESLPALEGLLRTSVKICPEVPVMVGGPPFSRAPGLWSRLGAAAMAPSLEGALELGRELVRSRSVVG